MCVSLHILLEGGEWHTDNVRKKAVFNTMYLENKAFLHY